MSMTELEIMAREHLSDHYLTSGQYMQAKMVLDPSNEDPGTKVIIQAVMNALSKAPPGHILAPINNSMDDGHVDEMPRMESFWTSELNSRAISVPGWGRSKDGRYLAEAARSYWKAWQEARTNI